MLKSFFDFLNQSPTAYHAVRNIAAVLEKQGFSQLKEEEKWRLEPGKSYYVCREGSALLAFRTPKSHPQNSVILASHVDSPALKIKPQYQTSPHGIGELLTESYGAPILHTWFDRDLYIAGRIIGSDKKGRPFSELVHLTQTQLLIPSVAIHLARDVNEKGPQINRQDHMRAVFSLKPKERHLEELLRKNHSFHELLGMDLFLVPMEPAKTLGFDQELISSYRLDNLSSAYASMQALVTAKAKPEVIQMAIFWDSEEIGSQTYAGAESLFVEQALERICLLYKMEREELYRLKASSLCLSCDVSHAMHPNYPEKYDSLNASVLGKGAVVKFSPRYATTGFTAARLSQIAKKKKLPLQSFASRSDASSGGTVGAIMGANLSIPTVDLGVGCWGMHSIRETISTQDQKALEALLKAALEESLIPLEEL